MEAAQTALSATPQHGEMLHDWHTTSFEAQTRSGEMATEWLWCNFPPPVELHDYRYLGENFTDRQRITRKRKRWVARLEKMPLLERQMLLQALREVESP